MWEVHRAVTGEKSAGNTKQFMQCWKQVWMHEAHVALSELHVFGITVLKRMYTLQIYPVLGLPSEQSPGNFPPRPHA